MTKVKFCGFTRPADASLAATLGADYLGCVLAGGPRHRNAEQAAAIFAGLARANAGGPRLVGVFAEMRLEEVKASVETARLDVVQLHGGGTPDQVGAAKRALGVEVWAVVRCLDGELPPELDELWDAADAVLLDAHVAGRLGGTGVALPWDRMAGALARSREAARGRGRLVLAGGLAPDNVARAIRSLSPDVVDTSSGIEIAPGIKDLARMKAFLEAARPPGGRRSGSAESRQETGR